MDQAWHSYANEQEIRIEELEQLRIKELFARIESKDRSTNKYKYSLRDLVDYASEFNLDLIRLRNASKQTALHIAAGFGRRTVVSYLLKNGAEVEARDADGRAPLHYCCNHAHNTVTRMLIESGADVNMVTSNGWTPLHFVVARPTNASKIDPKYWEVVDSLLEFGANPFLESNSGHNCFARIQDSNQRLLVRLKYIAYKLKSLDVHDRLSQESIIDRYLRVKDYFELVMMGEDNLEIFRAMSTKRLVNSRLEVRHVNITPLHRAAGHDRVEAAKLLLGLGADVNAVDDNGRIPLHNAASWGHVQMITLLINSGSDKDKQDCDGSSPMHLAAAAPNNTAFLACQTLLGFGANITLSDNNGKLPYDLAISEDVKELLYTSNCSERLVREQTRETTSNPDRRLLDYLEHFIETVSSRIPLNGFAVEKIVLDKNDWAYQSIVKRMHNTIGVHSGESACKYSSYDVISIEMVVNMAAWEKHKLKRRALEIDYGSSFANERLLFHGTNGHYIDKIVSKGFELSYADRSGMFGAGLYLAEHSSKSNQYTFNKLSKCPGHNEICCYECERKLILAKVTLGKCFTTEQDIPGGLNHAPPGFSSVAGLPGTNLCYPEYCIYNGDQAYPAFVITYRIRP